MFPELFIMSGLAYSYNKQCEMSVFLFQIVGSMLELEKMVDDYESLTTVLLEWIKAKIVTLNDRNFPNSLEGIQKELISFKEYRTVEKPPK